MKFQIQVIEICGHQIKMCSCLNGSLPGCTIEFEPTTSIHWGLRFFINENLCYEVRNDSKMLLNWCLEFLLRLALIKWKKILLVLFIDITIYADQ